MNRTHHRRARLGRGAAGLLAGVGLGATLAGGSGPAVAGDTGPPDGTGGTGPTSAPAQVRVHAAPTPRHWDPLTDAKWSFERGQVVLTERGADPGGPRRPFELAVVTKGPELSSVSISAEVRIDEPVEFSNRDVVLIWNYRSPTRFYYAHLSQDNTIYPHNGIFVVDDADRRRIDDQWNGTVGAPPAIDDTDWHDVRVDHDAATGEIEVYVDGTDEPLMTATDTTWSGGRIGFGSFDNYGRARHVSVVGTPAR